MHLPPACVRFVGLGSVVLAVAAMIGVVAVSHAPATPERTIEARVAEIRQAEHELHLTVLEDREYEFDIVWAISTLIQCERVEVSITVVRGAS